jgi:beta-xylosidase
MMMDKDEFPPDELIDDLLASTDNLIRIMKSKENKMTEERENTIQTSFTTDDPYKWGDVVDVFMHKLRNSFGNRVRGKFIVTIEFHPEDEAEDE